MKFFIDSCDVKEIAELHELGLVDGVTTNPSLIAYSGRSFHEVIKEICEIVKTSVSAEVIAADFEGMMREAGELQKLAPQVTIKLPLTWDGLKACKYLTSSGHTVNMTLCFSLNQALLAAKAGATYISPFIGRLEDHGEDGLRLIASICEVFYNYPEITTQVLVASVRRVEHVNEAARLGADIVTLPPALLRTFHAHPLTDARIKKFMDDWDKAKSGRLSKWSLSE